MTNSLIIYLGLLLFILSIIQSNTLYRATGFYITFCLMVIATCKDMDQAFISIIAGMAVHILMISSIKEYTK